MQIRRLLELCIRQMLCLLHRLLQSLFCGLPLMQDCKIWQVQNTCATASIHDWLHHQRCKMFCQRWCCALGHQINLHSPWFNFHMAFAQAADFLQSLVSPTRWSASNAHSKLSAECIIGFCRSGIWSSQRRFPGKIRTCPCTLIQITLGSEISDDIRWYKPNKNTFFCLELWMLCLSWPTWTHVGFWGWSLPWFGY